MYLLPAIDLIDGKCVRLIQGQYDRKIDYNDDPSAQAEAFIGDGAEWLHVVDLEGAKIGKPVNTSAIENIAKLGKLKVEVGGGIRNEESIRKLLDIGVYRVIIGTQAVNEFGWFCEMAEKFPGKIALGLDGRGTKVSTHGWTQDSPQRVVDFAKQCEKLPLSAIIYTDISKDGMMSGPNLEATRDLAEAISTPVIASGGVNTVEDILEIKKTKIAGAIIGRALYEKTLSLADAIEAAS